MKKRVFLCMLIIVLLVSGCGYGAHYNLKADDAISRAVYEEFGDAVYYQGKLDTRDKHLCYRFLIREEKSDLLYNIVMTINETIEKEGITDRIEVDLCFELPGALGNFARLFNYDYSDKENAIPEYEGLQRLVIIGNDEEDESYLYNDPAVYVTLPNIKYLKVAEEIQERAKQEGIDWYEYWPELETVETF